MIMHWPFGVLIFAVSGISIYILLAASAWKSQSEKGLKYLLLLYPLTRFIFWYIFHYHFQIPWWIMDFLMTGIIPVTLAVNWFRAHKLPAGMAK